MVDSEDDDFVRAGMSRLGKPSFSNQQRTIQLQALELQLEMRVTQKLRREFQKKFKEFEVQTLTKVMRSVGLWSISVAVVLVAILGIIHNK